MNWGLEKRKASVKKSFSSTKYVCIRAEAAWKLTEAGGTAGGRQKIRNWWWFEAFIFAQQQHSDYSGLASELMRTSHINPGPLCPFNRLVTWQEMHIWNSQLRIYCEQGQQVWRREFGFCDPIAWSEWVCGSAATVISPAFILGGVPKDALCCLKQVREDGQTGSFEFWNWWRSWAGICCLTVARLE